MIMLANIFSGINLMLLIFEIIIGLIVGGYTFYKLEDILSYFKVSYKPKLIIKIVISAIFFILILNFASLQGILIIYLLFSLFVSDIIHKIYCLIFKNRENKPYKFMSKINKSGLLALILFLILVIPGLYGISHIEAAEYDITTNKTNESYTIIFISDTHFDTIQDPQLLKNEIKNMNSKNPDLVILGGDMVDDQTSKESMELLFNELGKINSTYGTYFIFGNHDRNMRLFNATDTHFTNEELNNSITLNGIKILCDDKIAIGNEIILIGRDDKLHSSMESGRLSTKEILNDTNMSNFIIVADHQPVEYEENAKLGVDLQLSGHTHGGQLFPMNIINYIVGTLNYGKYQFGNMTQIVSSGFAGWGWPMKNTENCEYVIININ